MNLANIIDGHPDDSVALIDGATTVSYGQLRSRVAAARAVLDAHGIGAGSRVVMLCGNEVLFAVGALAALGLGATVAPLNPFSPTLEIQRKLEPLDADLALVGEIGAHLVDDGDSFGIPLLDMATVPTSPADDTSVPDVIDVEPSTLALLLSTSGVSGVPKVAKLTHRNLDWVSNALCSRGIDSPRPDDVVLAVLPFAHVLGLNLGLLMSLRVGATVVLQRRFDVDKSIELIGTHQVTLLTGAPPMWQRWSEADVPRDAFSSVRFARSGAAALPSDVHQRFKDRFGLHITEGYGLTESTGTIVTGRGVGPRPTSVGTALEGMEVVLVDDEGTPVDVGDYGEIVLRGPAVFAGYLDEADTAMSLTSDGWLWTGDVGVVDDDGFLYLVDRLKDVIIVSGFNVYPAEVENVLNAHPDVRGAIVVGEGDPVTGEAVVAYVSGDVESDELKRFARRHLSSYKCPTTYRMVEKLPDAPNGKTVRRSVGS